MLNKFQQGTIIYGMKSSKYTECATYAVIISARCDIANSKISKMYYLTAVDAMSWFTTEHGFHLVYDKVIKQEKNTFAQKINQYELNSDMLLRMMYEDGKKVIDSINDTEKKKKVIYDAYEKIYKMVNESSDYEFRKQVIRKQNKYVIEFLNNISNGVMNHYFYIPKKAYLKEGTMHEGIIVDLQEIGILEFQDANQIITPGIDYKLLKETKNEEERKRLFESYWLCDENCFVEIEDTIRSPWCELLMQRFSNDFIRIGVDGAGNEDFKKLADEI